MRNLIKVSLLALVAFAGVSLEAQTAQTATTLSAAIASSQTTFSVVSTTGITPNSTILYVDNEAMFVNSQPAAGILAVTRGYAGTKAFAHKSGTMVLAAPPAAFISFDPSGSCTNGQGLFAYSPIVNVVNGNQWLCSTVTGKIVPGFANAADQPQVTAAVASIAGKITPSGPLFHVTGTAAITGFNVPVGFDPTAGGTICAIPDGIFTTTNANNIALGSTAAVNKQICWSYDGGTKLFYPSY
jgi:hypothetical protein